jgi:hypothetical protein
LCDEFRPLSFSFSLSICFFNLSLSFCSLFSLASARSLLCSPAQADVLCRKDKWSPARDLMQYARNPKGAFQPAVWEHGKKVGGGCPGMNPWHDGWKLHKLKGSVLVR